MDAQEILSLITGLLGLAGLVWTGIRFYRHDPQSIADVHEAAASRKRFLATWLILAVLAFVVGVTLWLTIHTAADQTDLAQRTADQAKATSDDTLAYLRGEQGIPGVPGASGVDGTPGLPGSEGEPGKQGPPGPQGEKGAKGDTGNAGAQGPQGAVGATTVGAPGPMGPQGQKGSTGSTGAKGATGPTGQKGATGAQGATGATGAPGPAATSSTATAVGSSANDTATMKVANATCPPGMRVSGGGFAIVPSDPGIIPTATGPVGTNGWSATVEQLSLPPGTAWQVLVFAQCV